MTTDTAAYQAAQKAFSAPAPTQAQFTTNGVFDRKSYSDAQRAWATSQKAGAPDIKNYQTDTGVAPQYQSNVTLSPEMQKLFDQTQHNQNDLASTASDLMGQIKHQADTPIDYSSFIKNPTMGDLGGISQNAQDAIMHRLQPDMDLQREQKNAELLNQGITSGSEAWNNGWRTLDNAQNDAKQQAVLAAGQEAQQLQGTALAGRNQQIQEAYQQQQAPINQYEALAGQTQVQMPSFSGAPSSSAPGAQVPAGGQALEQQYAQQMQAYNAQLASQNSTMGGLFGLGGQLGAAWLMA